MVLSFADIDFKDKPPLILKNFDEKIIGYLGFTFDETFKLAYNETSEFSFSMPKMVDGEAVPHYDEVVGMRILEVPGMGRFITVNPSTRDDGISEIKTCKAYSLEYEFVFKKISLPNGTYPLWNPLVSEESILDIILERMPSWSVGYVDSTLITKYRTFEVNDENIYQLIKSTLQNTYSCIFEFDTFKRLINIRDTSNRRATKQIYLSLDNLLDTIEISEDTDGIFTCIDVNGAEGVTIGRVNPLGTNKIYNLDYFMEPDRKFLPQDMINKWNAWKVNYESLQSDYYDLTIQESLQTARLITEQARLTDLKGELGVIQAAQATYAEAVASNAPSFGQDFDELLRQSYIDIANKNSEIALQESVIQGVQMTIDSIQADLTDINRRAGFAAFFTPSELIILDRYIKEDAMTDTTFVVSNVENYTQTNKSTIVRDRTFIVTDSDTTIVRHVTQNNKFVYTVRGGKITSTDPDIQLDAEIIRATFEVNADNTFIMTAFLNKGVIQPTQNADGSFPSGSLSLSGKLSSVSNNGIPDPNIPNMFQATSFTFTTDPVEVTNMFFTRNTTEYERWSVESSLLEYGEDVLSKLAYPMYTFNVSSANFLTIDDFLSFKNQLSLGDEVYLKISEDQHLKPIVINVQSSFEDISSLTITFSNTYSAADSVFQLSELIEQSVSMGKNADFSKFNYNSFVDSNASSVVRDFINSALDVSRNAVVSSTGQAISWNDNGVRLRKHNPNAPPGAVQEDELYDKDQIWMINNSIVFSDDWFQSAKMAIGKFVDANAGEVWGIVAPHIVGTALAGESLIIESVKKSPDGAGNEVSVFRVDGEGVRLHNAQIDVFHNNDTQITLNPELGIAIGEYPVYNANGTVNENNAKFWVDLDGNVHLKGVLEAATGRFDGDVYARNFYFNDGGDVKALLTQQQKQIPSDYLDLGNIIIDGANGNISFAPGGSIDFSGAGSITWNSANPPVKYQFSANGISGWHEVMQASDMYRRDSTDGGITWGPAYQFRGRDGVNGSDGTDAEVNYENISRILRENYSITSTNLTESMIESPVIRSAQLYSPEIYGNFLSLTPLDNTGANPAYFSLSGAATGIIREFFNITYSAGSNPIGVVSPHINMSIPAGGSLFIGQGADRTYFLGELDFSNADVTGLNITAKYA